MTLQAHNCHEYHFHISDSLGKQQLNMQIQICNIWMSFILAELLNVPPSCQL